MREDFRLKGVPTIIPGVVTSIKNAGRQVGVRLEHWTDNDYPDPGIQVRVVGSRPRLHDRGLVLFIDNMDEDFQNGYWLGVVANRFVDKDKQATTAEQHENKLPTGSRGMMDDSGNNQIILSGSDIRIKSQQHELNLSPRSFKISNGANAFTIDDEGLSAYTIKSGAVTSKFILNNKQSEMYSASGILFRADGDINIKSNGNIYFGANSGDNKSLSLFHVKSSKIVLESGSGPFTVQGSQFNIKVGSSQANMLGSSAASIEALQGNIDISAGVGNITLRALSAAHKVKITNGFTAAGIQSYFEANVTSAKIAAELVPGLGASVECTRTGDIKITALKSIALNSTLGTTIKAMTTMELNAIISMKLETIKMDIIAQTLLKVQTMMLDLKAAKTIDAGPKVVTPGTGPFCSMPNCPILGVPLQGSIAIG